MQKKTIISLSVILILVSSALTYFFGPKKVEYKEKIKLVEVVKTEVRLVTRKEKRPDGTTIETTIQEQIKEDIKTKDKEVAKKVTPIKRDWFVTASISTDKDYTISVQRRIVFDIYAGIYARSDKEIGLAVSYSF